jgi:hypothetical protein
MSDLIRRPRAHSDSELWVRPPPRPSLHSQCDHDVAVVTQTADIDTPIGSSSTPAIVSEGRNAHSDPIDSVIPAEGPEHVKSAKLPPVSEDANPFSNEDQVDTQAAISDHNSEHNDNSLEAKSEINLTSRFQSHPDLGIWSVSGLTIVLVCFAIYYSWNASLSSTPSALLLWNAPDNTIFTIGLLSYLSTLFVNYLITSVSDYVGRNRASTHDGIAFLNFLALSSQTSIWGLIHLIISPFPPITHGPFLSTSSIGHRLWALQRFDPLVVDHELGSYSTSFNSSSA